LNEVSILATIAIHVEFCSGIKGPLFRLTRTPQSTKAHVLFIAPLFEQANQTRHHITRSAINGYHQNLETIIFDHYGTGDSAGDLHEVELVLWQQDIAEQISVIRRRSAKPIYLSLPLSAILLLTPQMLSDVTGIFLLQPEFNGKRFIQQFKRLALVAKPIDKDKVREDDPIEKSTIEIAGYQMQEQLLTDIAQRHVTQLSSFAGECYWFEWLSKEDKLNARKVKQQQSLEQQCSIFRSYLIADLKFWQTSSLTLSANYLEQEKILFSQLDDTLNSTSSQASV
jgi:exosortase A-associated hydrolase 2